MTGRYVVHLRGYRIIGALSVLFFGVCAVGAFMAQQYGPIAIFGFFVAKGFTIIAAAGPYELSDTGVVQRNLFGRFEMRWRDVDEVELGPQGTLLLRGRDKRFSLSPTASWRGPDTPKAVELLQSKLDRPDIELRPSAFADFKTHKNVRV